MKKLIAAVVVLSVLAALAENPHIARLAELLDVALSSPADGDQLTFDASSNKWVNHPAARPQRIDFLNLAGGQSDTTLFTADESANYRVTITAETSAAVTVQLFDQSFFDIFTVGPDARGVTAVFRANAGDAILLNTSISQGTYSLHFGVEKL